MWPYTDMAHMNNVLPLLISAIAHFNGKVFGLKEASLVVKG